MERRLVGRGHPSPAPRMCPLMSVSEWGPAHRARRCHELPSTNTSISGVGPGPRAKTALAALRAKRGLPVIAKIQAGQHLGTLRALPYIPAVSLVAEHAQEPAPPSRSMV